MNWNTRDMSKFYKHFFFILLATLSLGQLQRIQLSQILAIYLHDILIIIWLSVSTIFFRDEWHSVFERIQNLVRKHFALRWFLIIAIINLAFHTLMGTMQLTSYLHIDRVLLYLLFAASLPFTSSLTHAAQRLAWTLVGVVIAWLGLVQYFLLPDTRFLVYLGWDDHYFRLISTLLDPNFTGIILLVSLFYLWSLKNLPPPIKILASGLLGVAQLLTLSRATYLSVMVSVGLLLWWQLGRRALKYFGGLLVAAIIAIALIPKPSGEGVNLLRIRSIEQRLLSNQVVIMSMKPHEWIVGRGLFMPLPRVFGSQLPQHARFPDNLIIFVLTGLGVPGFLFATALVINITKWLYRHDQYLCTAWIAILIHSQFNHTFFEPFVFLMLLGGIASMTRLKAKTHT